MMAFDTRKKILSVMEFPMSIGEIRAQARTCYEAAQKNLEWLFSMGMVHTSRDPKGGILLYHKSEFKHPSMLLHLSMQEIEERKKKGLLEEGAGRKEAELKEAEEQEEKLISEETRKAFEDFPAARLPEDEENIESEIKIEEED